MSIQHKTVAFKVDNIDFEGRTFEGHAAVFGNVDLGGDIIHPGAFTKTLNERGGKIKLLWQHDTSEPLGRPLELAEDDAGLFVKAIISDTRRGRDALALLRDGAINEMSIGYETVKGGTDYGKAQDGAAVRNLREVKLWEVSIVTLAMNPEAQITALKEADALEDKAAWTAAYVNDLPDSAFLYIESGGEKDDDGKTTPRNLRHLPYRNAESDLDLPHLRAALSRLGQEDTGGTGGESWLSDAVRKRLRSRAERLLEQATGNKAVNYEGIVQQIRAAFYALNPETFERAQPAIADSEWIQEVWDDFVIVETDSGLFKATYTIDADGNVTFAPRDQWEQVEVAYVPAKSIPAPAVEQVAHDDTNAEPQAGPDAKAAEATDAPPTSITLEQMEALLFEIELLEV